MSLILKGRVASGAKEGAYFISKYRSKLVNAVGFEPFPGTLNVEASLPPKYPMKSNFIHAWKDGAKEYGAVWCYPAVLLNHKCAVIVPEHSHHSSKIIEIISPYPLRTKFGLKDGDYVTIEVEEVEK